jgi:hypothetical protein
MDLFSDDDAMGLPDRKAQPCAHLLTRRVGGRKCQCSSCGAIIGEKRAGIDAKTRRPSWLPKKTKGGKAGA